MPEGVEAHIIAMQLHARLFHKELLDVKILSGRYETSLPSWFKDMKEDCPMKFKSIFAFGKLLVFFLRRKTRKRGIRTCSRYLLNTLGMTGHWSDGKMRKHSRMEFVLDDGSSIFFVDQRNFGTLRFTHDKKVYFKKAWKMNVDMLRFPYRTKKMHKHLKKYESIVGNEKIGDVMLNQRIFTGVGNYIRAESLYRAKLSPHRVCSSLTINECNSLHRAICAVMHDSLRCGGASLSDMTYSDIRGVPGRFSDAFLVYGKKIDFMGNEVISEKMKNKRTIWWVPAVQH